MTPAMQALQDRATVASDTWSDEQDRSDWMEGEAYGLASLIDRALAYLSNAEGIDEYTFETVQAILTVEDDQ